MLMNPKLNDFFTKMQNLPLENVNDDTYKKNLGKTHAAAHFLILSQVLDIFLPIIVETYKKELQEMFDPHPYIVGQIECAIEFQQLLNQ